MELTHPNVHFFAAWREIIFVPYLCPIYNYILLVTMVLLGVIAIYRTV